MKIIMRLKIYINLQVSPSSRKHVSCRFCPEFALPDDTFVGNYFLRILETAGNFPTEISSGKANSIRMNVLVRVEEIPLPVNISYERSACNSATKPLIQVIPQEVSHN
ncbi:hypothetical protein MTR_1g072080 [Medicago truncatula]|uniref:Uncharacterized protein n=1 Tax=Medicago truncatula TaxID=3880 RepID=G7IDP1_MEDTR|nr:hypothetical protein MTR_1g072080 [Medicago truncatula]